MSPQVNLLKVAREWGPIVLLLIGAKVIWPAERLTSIESRLTSVEELRGDVEAMALSLCLVETHPIVRQRLKCGQREAQAGIRR